MSEVVSPSRPPSQARRHIWSLAGIVALATFVRLWGTFDYPEFIFDESIHVPAARSLASHGTPGRWDWAHPPLAGLLRLGGMAVFGDTPVGWRFTNVLLGTLTVVLLWLVANRLLGGRHGAFLAAALIALDPLHACTSRSTLTEIPATAFFLLFVYFILRAGDGGRTARLAAGVSLGLTLATKEGYFVASATLLVLLTAYRELRRSASPLRIACEYALDLGAVPLAVYVATYLPWLARGYSLAELVRMRLDAVWMLANLRAESFPAYETLRLGGEPWEWFVKPIAFGHRFGASDGTERFLLEINNPPFRLLVWPSVAFLLYRGWRGKDLQTALPALLFASGYLIFLVPRPMYSYSSIALLPAAYLALAGTFESLVTGVARATWARATFGALVLAGGIYTFPLYSTLPVPAALYAPVLSFARFVVMN